MPHAIAAWILAAGFLGAGLFNAIGAPGQQGSFVRWGYPRWWCRMTGALEMGCAVLIALPATRGAGLMLGAAIVAAVATVLRHREPSHLVPLGAFVVLLVLADLSLS